MWTSTVCCEHTTSSERVSNQEVINQVIEDAGVCVDVGISLISNGAGSRFVIFISARRRLSLSDPLADYPL